MSEPKWRFRDFVDERGRSLIAKWLDELPPTAAAEINARLELIGALEKLERPYVAHEGDGILKIRVKSGDIQYRPLACYGPARREITLLIGAIDAPFVSFPPRLDEAKRRKAIVGSDPSRTCEHEDY